MSAGVAASTQRHAVFACWHDHAVTVRPPLPFEPPVLAPPLLEASVPASLLVPPLAAPPLLVPPLPRPPPAALEPPPPVATEPPVLAEAPPVCVEPPVFCDAPPVPASAIGARPLSPSEPHATTTKPPANDTRRKNVFIVALV